VSELRHPLDPDPVPATKASAVFALGLTAALTGVVLGGVVPATIALLLAREVRGDLVAAQGFLVGTRRLRRGVQLAWIGIVLACAAIVAGAILALYRWAGAGGVDYGSTVN
jgi:hypothetical protein